MSEVQKILDKTYHCTHAKEDDFTSNEAEQALYALLMEKAEQRQIVVAYKKDQHHTPILQDWQAIPVSAINEIFGRTE